MTGQPDALDDGAMPGVKSLEDFTTAAWATAPYEPLEAASHASQSERAQLTQHRASAKTSLHFTNTNKQ